MRTNLRNLKPFGALAGGLMTLALALALALAPPAEGKGKPGGGDDGGDDGGGEPGPVPPGTIYYLHAGEDETNGVLADGTGLERALPFYGYRAEPSHLLYGDEVTNYRLWLQTEETTGTYITPYGDPLANRELFVYRDIQGTDAIESFPLTNLFGSFLPFWEGVRWSNDGQDSFISFGAVDVRNAQDHVDADGNIHFNENFTLGIYRIQISASEIDGEPLIGNPELVETVALIPKEFPAASYQHGWSWDGNKLVYLRRDENRNFGVYVKDPAETGPGQKIYAGSHDVENPRFSPTDDMILVNDDYDVVLINLVTGGSSVLTRYWGSTYWSPDGEHVSLITKTQAKYRGQIVSTNFVSRLEVETGEVTKLIEMNASILRPWVSNDLYDPAVAGL